MSKIEFPRWIYKGKTEQKIVQTLEEYQTALSEGWRKGVIDEAGLIGESEAPEAPEAPDAPDETMSYRAMLEANAKKLNIKFGIKTSNAQLAAMIQRRG